MIIYNNIIADDIEINKKCLMMELKNIKKTIELLKNPQLKILLEKWQDKKIYNKRLETELKNIDEHFFIDNNYFYYIKTIFFDYNERSFRNNDNQWIYIRNYEYSIFAVANDNRTINENLIELLNKRIEYFENEAKTLEKQIKNLNSIIKKYLKIIDSYNNFENEVNYTIRQYFNMTLTR